MIEILLLIVKKCDTYSGRVMMLDYGTERGIKSFELLTFSNLQLIYYEINIFNFFSGITWTTVLEQIFL